MIKKKALLREIRNWKLKVCEIDLQEKDKELKVKIYSFENLLVILLLDQNAQLTLLSRLVNLTIVCLIIDVIVVKDHNG